MLLHELHAKDTDLSEYDKKLMVNILISDDKGLNIKTLYIVDPNSANLKSSKDKLLKLNFIKETDMKDFYVLTEEGLISMFRSSLIDDNNKLIDAHASKYLYK